MGLLLWVAAKEEVITNPFIFARAFLRHLHPPRREPCSQQFSPVSLMLADSTTREDSAVKRSKGIVLTFFFFFFFFFLYHTSLTLEKHLFGPAPSFTGLWTSAAASSAPSNFINRYHFLSLPIDFQTENLLKSVRIKNSILLWKIFNKTLKETNVYIRYFRYPWSKPKYKINIYIYVCAILFTKNSFFKKLFLSG